VSLTRNAKNKKKNTRITNDTSSQKRLRIVNDPMDCHIDD